MSYIPVSLAVATQPPQPSFQQCYTPISSPSGGLHTQNMTPCADRLQYFQPSTPMSDLRDNSPTFSSGSSAHHSSNATDDDVEEHEQERPSPIVFSPVSEVFEYRSLLDAPPIYSLDSMLGYGAARVLFIEKLLWSCVGKIYGIYGEPIIRTRSFVASMPLQQLVHEGIVHGLCNEIVIMPIMAATQKQPGSQHQHADVIPFPLFMAEMLRRMRSSYFLLQTAMRYILDIEQQIRAARDRAVCGWCRSGVYGCEHSSPPERGSTSRFAKGRSANLRKLAAHNQPLKPTDFTTHDVLHPLSDPRKAFLGALILANKFHRDRSIGNKAWAAMIGLQLEEVHSAERAVGKALGWTLSRPWVRDVRDDSGSWTPGSTHPSFAEPLFASTDAEATKYGVKALRETGGIPAALDSRQLATEFPRGDIYIDSIYSAPPNSQPFPLPDALSRRSRSQTFSLTEERPIAPLPQRSAQVFLQPRTKSSNVIKKGSSAPDVLQQSFHGGNSLAVEIDMAMQSEWTTLTSTRNPLDNLMDATPTMEQVRSKRKASQDFGPNTLLRRGILGQRVLIHSPDEMASAISHSANASQDHQWDMCDDESCPELSPGTLTTTSPSIGLLTRTNTPSNLLEMTASITRPVWPPPHKNPSSQCFVPFGLADCSSHHPGPHSYDGLVGTSSDLSVQH